METEQKLASTKPKVEEGNAQYPYYTLEECLPRMRVIANHYGIGSTPISRKDICILLGKAEPTLVYFFGTTLQYGLLNNAASKGVIVTDLFQQIEAPVYGEPGKKASMTEALNNPPIYRKLIDTYNGKILPNEDGLANLLKTKEYSVNSNSAARAAKIFFENGKLTDIIDGSNRLRYILPSTNGVSSNNGDGNANSGANTNQVIPPTPQDPPLQLNTFELPIDLGGNIAYLKYPRNITLSEIEILKIMVNAAISALETRHKKAEST